MFIRSTVSIKTDFYLKIIVILIVFRIKNAVLLVMRSDFKGESVRIWISIERPDLRLETISEILISEGLRAKEVSNVVVIEGISKLWSIIVGFDLK